MAAAVIAAVAFVATRPDGTISPTPPDTAVPTAPGTTAPLSTPPPSTAPATSVAGAAGVNCSGVFVDPVQLAFVTVSRLNAWTVAPDRCVDSRRLTTGFTIDGAPIADMVAGYHATFTIDEIRQAAPGAVIERSAAYDDPWGNLALVGAVTDDVANEAAVFMRTDDAVIRIDLPSRDIHVVTFSASTPPFPGIFMTPVCAAGDSVFVLEQAVLRRADFDTGTLGAPAVAEVTSCTTSSVQRVVPRVRAALWGLAGAPANRVVRVSPDGTVLSTPEIPGQLMMLYPGDDTAWVLMYHPGETVSMLDPAHPMHLVRIDLVTGALLAQPGNPPNSFSTDFAAYAGTQGVLAVSDRDRLWYVANDGTTTALPPIDFDVVDVTGDLFIGRRDDGTIVVAIITPATAAAPDIYPLPPLDSLTTTGVEADLHR